MIYLKSYAFTLIVFFGLDLLWIGLLARGFYFSQIGSLMRDNINYIAAGGFYLAYVGGIVFFAVSPALTDNSWQRAALNGFLLGLIAYGTYDMTNLATLKDWPLPMTLVDIVWGGVITSVSATIGMIIARGVH